MSFGFYHDPALSDPVASDHPLGLTEQASPAGAVARAIVYFGSAWSGLQVQAAGGGPIVLSLAPVSAPAPGAVHPVTDYKLALSDAGLDTAIAGASLSLPSAVAGGAGNAVAIHIEANDSTGQVGLRQDVRILTPTLTERDA